MSLVRNINPRCFVWVFCTERNSLNTMNIWAWQTEGKVWSNHRLIVLGGKRLCCCCCWVTANDDHRRPLTDTCCQKALTALKYSDTRHGVKMMTAWLEVALFIKQQRDIRAVCTSSSPLATCWRRSPTSLPRCWRHRPPCPDSPERKHKTCLSDKQALVSTNSRLPGHKCYLSGEKPDFKTDMIILKRLLCLSKIILPSRRSRTHLRWNWHQTKLYCCLARPYTLIYLLSVYSNLDSYLRSPGAFQRFLVKSHRSSPTRCDWRHWEI